jgi:hypothetical protein
MTGLVFQSGSEFQYAGSREKGVGVGTAVSILKIISTRVSARALTSCCISFNLEGIAPDSV